MLPRSNTTFEDCPKTFIGIDPGVTGAIAILNINNKGKILDSLIEKMPETARELHEFRPQILWSSWSSRTWVIVEQVHSSPQQGNSGAFTFGNNFGRCEMWAAQKAQRDNVHYVTPIAWQNALSCRTGGDKQVSFDYAQLKFPEIKLRKYAADALLIAYYGYLKYGRTEK